MFVPSAVFFSHRHVTIHHFVGLKSVLMLTIHMRSYIHLTTGYLGFMNIICIYYVTNYIYVSENTPPEIIQKEYQLDSNYDSEP